MESGKKPLGAPRRPLQMVAGYGGTPKSGKVQVLRSGFGSVYGSTRFANKHF